MNTSTAENPVQWLFLDLNAFFASCEQQDNPATARQADHRRTDPDGFRRRDRRQLRGQGFRDQDRHPGAGRAAA
jgi:hypothetical protein